MCTASPVTQAMIFSQVPTSQSQVSMPPFDPSPAFSGSALLLICLTLNRSCSKQKEVAGYPEPGATEG